MKNLSSFDDYIFENFSSTFNSSKFNKIHFFPIMIGNNNKSNITNYIPRRNKKRQLSFNKKKLFLNKKGFLNTNNNFLLTKSKSFSNYNFTLPNKNIAFDPEEKSIYKIVNFKKDKEEIINENLNLKTQINFLKKEINKIKLENIKKENEIQKKESIINKTLEINKENYNTFLANNNIYDNAINNELIYKLRKQFLALKKENEKNLNEIIILKKNIKNSKYNEILIENQTILQEFKKLKSLYNFQLNEYENLNLKIKEIKELKDNISKQNFIIIKLKEEIENLNIENENLKIEYEKIKKNYFLAQNEIKKQRIEIIKNNDLNEKNSIELKKNEKTIKLLNNKIERLIFESKINQNLNQLKVQENNNENKNETTNSEKKNQEQNSKFKEITYILIKNFEANKITKNEILNEVFFEFEKNLKKNNKNNPLIEKNEVINLLSENIFNLLNIKNNSSDKDKIHYFIDNLLTISNNELLKFKENFLQILDSVKIYTEKEKFDLTQKLKLSLSKYKTFFLQNYKKDYISFFKFRNLLNDQNIKLNDDCIEFLIYQMKCDCPKIINEKISLFDLCYKTIFNFTNNDEILYENEIIEITNSEYENTINDALQKIKISLEKNDYKNLKQLINLNNNENENNNINNTNLDKNIEKFSINKLNKLFIEKLDLYLINLEIYTLYNKYKIENDDNDFIDITKLDNDINFINKNQNMNQSNFYKIEKNNTIKEEKNDISNEKINYEKEKEEEELLKEYNFKSNDNIISNNENKKSDDNSLINKI